MLVLTVYTKISRYPVPTVDKYLQKMLNGNT